MKQALANANWMDGFVWFLVMAMAWSAYEFIHVGAPVTPAAIAFVLIVWGGAGAGYAILSGWLAARRAAAPEPQAPSADVAEKPATPVASRAERRRAERGRKTG